MDDRDVKSVANEVSEEVRSLFAKKKKADLDKIKMPKAVSRSKAKNGVVSYDVDSLANRFGVLYPDMKDEIKRNIATYGEFLPETFFTEYGTPRVLEVMRSGREADIKKLFKALGEIYEDGTNEVQDIIGVTILGEMKNDPQLMEIACMVLFFCYGTAGAPHPTKKFLQMQGAMWASGRAHLSAHILEYTCQILHTCPAIQPTLATICTISLAICQSIGFFYKNQRFCLTKR